MNDAVRQGDFERVKALHAQKCPWNTLTTCAAADGGHLEILQWLHANGCPWNECTPQEAARSGHRGMLEFIFSAIDSKEKQDWDWPEVMEGAAYGNHFEILKWIYDRVDVLFGGDSYEFAAGHGNLEMLQWLQGEGGDWDSDTCTAAACNGHLEVLKWAHENGCPWDAETYAAAKNHPEVLEYLRTNNCPQ